MFIFNLLMRGNLNFYEASLAQLVRRAHFGCHTLHLSRKLRLREVHLGVLFHKSEKKEDKKFKKYTNWQLMHLHSMILGVPIKPSQLSEQW